MCYGRGHLLFIYPEISTVFDSLSPIITLNTIMYCVLTFSTQKLENCCSIFRIKKISWKKIVQLGLFQDWSHNTSLHWLIWTLSLNVESVQWTQSSAPYRLPTEAYLLTTASSDTGRWFESFILGPNTHLSYTSNHMSFV